MAMAANAAGLIARLGGDASEAKASHLQALAVFQELGSARLIREATGMHLTMIEGHDPQQAQAHARSVLGTKQFTAATDTGKDSSLDEMLALGASARGFKSGF